MCMKKDTKLRELNKFFTKYEDDYDDLYWAESQRLLVHLSMYDNKQLERVLSTQRFRVVRDTG